MKFASKRKFNPSHSWTDGNGRRYKRNWENCCLFCFGSTRSKRLEVWNDGQTHAMQGLQYEHQIVPINPFEGPQETGLWNIMTFPKKFNSKPTNTFVFLKSCVELNLDVNLS